MTVDATQDALVVFRLVTGRITISAPARPTWRSAAVGYPVGAIVMVVLIDRLERRPGFTGAG